MFIVFYGINNIGKTYHAKRLTKRLQKLGKKAVYIKYPIYSQKPSGLYINKILRSAGRQKIAEEKLQLLFVLNRYQFQPALRRMLKEGRIVVAEDYIATGIAWGTAKGASQAELERMNNFLVQEDLALLMDGTRIMKAKEKHHLHERDNILTAKCQRVYRKLAKKYKWKVVMVDVDPDITAARIWAIVKSAVNQARIS